MKETTQRVLGRHWRNFKKLFLSSCNVWENVTDTPKQFVKHGDKAVKVITSFYLPADVLIESDDIEASPRTKDTLQIPSRAKRA